MCFVATTVSAFQCQANHYARLKQNQWISALKSVSIVLHLTPAFYRFWPSSSSWPHQSKMAAIPIKLHVTCHCWLIYVMLLSLCHDSHLLFGTQLARNRHDPIVLSHCRLFLGLPPATEFPKKMRKCRHLTICG